MKRVPPANSTTLRAALSERAEPLSFAKTHPANEHKENLLS